MPSPEQQQRARIFGVLFALTFVTSIAGLLLYDPVLNDADYILGDGADTRVQLGALCEIFLAIANIGTAVDQRQRDAERGHGRRSCRFEADPRARPTPGK
jgi:hypothetical protein